MAEIRYSREAVKALKKAPRSVAQRILARIDALARAPETVAQHVRKLTGRPGYRVRVGDWRVIFEHRGSRIDILEIGPRGRIYD